MPIIRNSIEVKLTRDDLEIIDEMFQERLSDGYALTDKERATLAKIQEAQRKLEKLNA